MIGLFAQVQRPDSFADFLDYIALWIFLFAVLPLALVGWVITTIRDRRRLSRWRAENPPENWWTCSCPASPFNRHNIRTTDECLDCGDRATQTTDGLVVERRGRKPHVAEESPTPPAALREQEVQAHPVSLHKAQENKHRQDSLPDITEERVAAEESEVSPEPEPRKVVDLMEALKASVEATNQKTASRKTASRKTASRKGEPLSWENARSMDPAAFEAWATSLGVDHTELLKFSREQFELWFDRYSAGAHLQETRGGKICDVARLPCRCEMVDGRVMFNLVPGCIGIGEHRKIVAEFVEAQIADLNSGLNDRQERNEAAESAE